MSYFDGSRGTIKIRYLYITYNSKISTVVAFQGRGSIAKLFEF